MTARRWIVLALVVAIVALVAPPSRAQIPMLAHGIIHATTASVNVANSTAEHLLYQYPIPAALWASWTSNNTAFSSVPLHLRLNGGIKTVGTVGGITGNSLSVNLTTLTGTQMATMVIMNGAIIAPDLGAASACGGAAQNTCQAPISVDVVLNPIATLTTQNATDLRSQAFTAFLTGRVAVASTSQVHASGQQFASEMTYNATTFSQSNVNQTAVINVLFRWGSAASGNSLNIYNGVLKMGF